MRCYLLRWNCTPTSNKRKYKKRGIRYYAAENPEKIRNRIREQEERADRILPELRSLYGSSDAKPRIRYYEGIEGIKTVFEDTLTAHSNELQGILSMTDLYIIPGKEFMDSYVKRRIQKGYSLKVIRSKPKDLTKEVWQTSTQENRQLRYTPESMVFSMTTYLYDNKVSLISTEKESFGLIIESGEYALNMKNLFVALWQISTPI